MTSTTLCYCGEPLYQTDDGLMCKKGHSEQDSSGVIDLCPHGRTMLEPCDLCEQVVKATEKPLAEGGSTALPGSVPVGVTAPTVQDAVKGMEAFSADVRSINEKLNLPPGAFRTSDHRYYWNGRGPFPSVTTILNDTLLKHALDYHKRASVAKVIYRDSVGFFGENGGVPEKDAIKWALKAAEAERDEAGKIGTSVHLLADLQARMPPGASESDSKGFQVSEQEKPYLDAFKAFQGFLEARGGRIVSSEHMVWSEVGYAGTYDLIIQMPGEQWANVDGSELWLVDIKTSRGVYPEYALQLAAYGHAEQIILEGSPVGFPMPHIDRYAVLHLRPDAYPDTGYRLWEYPITDEDYYRFISTLDLYLWRKEDKFNKKNLIQVT